MILKELILENFGIYKGKHLINLAPKKDDNEAPIILFGGMNGGGKTTLIDAIKLVLYGQRSQCSRRGNLSYSDFLNQCRNKQILADENTKIELSFEHIINSQSVELRIIRHWQKNPKEGKDNLTIIEGDWPEKDLANNWDEYVEKILPLGISNLFLFDGEQVKELAEEEIPNSTIIDSIKSLLGLELPEKLNQDLDIFFTRKSKDCASASELKILEKIEAKLHQLNQDKEKYNLSLNTAEKDLKLYQKEYQKISFQLTQEEEKIATEKQLLKDKKNQYSYDLAKYYQEINSWVNGMLPLALITHQLEAIKIQGIQELQYQEAKIAENYLSQKNNKLLNYLKEINLTTDKLTQIINFLDQEKNNFEQKFKDFNSYLDFNNKSLQKLETILENILPNQKNNALICLEKINSLEIEITKIDELLINYEDSNRYEQLKADIQNLENKIKKTKENYDFYRTNLISIEKLIDEQKRDLAKYSQRLMESKNNQHLFDSIGKVKNTLITFKEKLTLRKIHKLELEITECFRYLLHKSNLVYRITIDHNNFVISLFDNQGNFIHKNLLSAGEKQLLAIALLWGLARVSGKILPIVIDTPLGRLDSSHRNNLIERYFPTASNQVILFSTDTEIGKKEVKKLRQQQAICREYLLEYDDEKNTTMIKDGYFW